MNDDNGSERVGPSVWLVPFVFAHSVLAWGGAVLLGWLHLPSVHRWLAEESSFPFVQEPLASLHAWMGSHHFTAIAVGMCALAAGRAVILYLTAEYTMDDTTLNVRYGFFCPSGPGGLSNVTNTLVFSMLVDVDVRQNPLQFMCNTGHLDVRMSNGEHVRLLSVPNPKKARLDLMARSNASEIRNYVPLPRLFN